MHTLFYNTYKFLELRAYLYKLALRYQLTVISMGMHVTAMPKSSRATRAIIVAESSCRCFGEPKPKSTNLRSRANTIRLRSYMARVASPLAAMRYNISYPR